MFFGFHTTILFFAFSYFFNLLRVLFVSNLYSVIKHVPHCWCWWLRRIWTASPAYCPFQPPCAPTCSLETLDPAAATRRPLEVHGIGDFQWPRISSLRLLKGSCFDSWWKMVHSNKNACLVWLSWFYNQLVRIDANETLNPCHQFKGQLSTV